MEAADQAAVLDALVAALREHYVFPERLPAVESTLRDLPMRDAGAASAPGAWAATVSAALQTTARDRHLALYYEERPIAERSVPAYGDPAWLETYHQQGAAENFGITRVEWLPGNLGYLELHQFFDVVWRGPTITAAMTVLAHTAALIIDVRDNQGGDPDTVALLASYLFAPERVHLNDFWLRDGNRTEQSWSFRHVPGTPYGREKPVIVLISRRTHSAAEEFAYDLQQRQRAVLVGEPTGGAAYAGDLYRLSDHFEAFIPNSRPINPVSGADWEGSGVQPDVAVPREQALAVAQGLVMEQLATAASDPTGSA